MADTETPKASDIESVKRSDLPPDDKDGKDGIKPSDIDGSQQTENADDNARPAPDANTPVPADTTGAGDTEDIFSRGYLTEDDAKAAAKGKRSVSVVAEGTAWKIVKD